jgi:hypothetical protein
MGRVKAPRRGDGSTGERPHAILGRAQRAAQRKFSHSSLPRTPETPNGATIAATRLAMHVRFVLPYAMNRWACRKDLASSTAWSAHGRLSTDTNVLISLTILKWAYFRATVARTCAGFRAAGTASAFCRRKIRAKGESNDSRLVWWLSRQSAKPVRLIDSSVRRDEWIPNGFNSSESFENSTGASTASEKIW